MTEQDHEANIGGWERMCHLTGATLRFWRIDPATGDGLSTNPFFDAAEPRAPRSRVWSLGHRNPYRMTVRPHTGSHNLADGDPAADAVVEAARSSIADAR